jgi:hypothetical protein
MNISSGWVGNADQSSKETAYRDNLALVEQLGRFEHLGRNMQYVLVSKDA